MPHARLKKYTAYTFSRNAKKKDAKQLRAVIHSPGKMLNPGSDGRGSGLPDEGHGSWKAGSVAALHRRLHDGCTRSQTLVIHSLMAVCEEGGFGVFVVAVGLLANGWSLVGAAPLVVGWAGKSEVL